MKIFWYHIALVQVAFVFLACLVSPVGSSPSDVEGTPLDSSILMEGVLSTVNENEGSSSHVDMGSLLRRAFYEKRDSRWEAFISQQPEEEGDTTQLQSVSNVPPAPVLNENK